MSARSRCLLMVVVVVLLPSIFTACGGGGPVLNPNLPPPSSTFDSTPPITSIPAAIAPSYYGTENIGSLTAPASVSLTQNGNQISGTWGNVFGGLVNVGTLTGTVTGSTFTATVTSAVPGQCAVSVSGIFGLDIGGHFATVPGCATPQSGGISMQPSGTPPAVSGSASGTISDSLYGPGTLSASITQTGVVLVGTFSDSFGVSGQFYGVIVGSTVYFDLVPSNPGACPFAASGTLSGNTLTGNYSAILCGVADSGTFNMTL